MEGLGGRDWDGDVHSRHGRALRVAPQGSPRHQEGGEQSTARLINPGFRWQAWAFRDDGPRPHGTRPALHEVDGPPCRSTPSPSGGIAPHARGESSGRSRGSSLGPPWSAVPEPPVGKSPGASIPQYGPRCLKAETRVQADRFPSLRAAMSSGSDVARPPLSSSIQSRNSRP